MLADPSQDHRPVDVLQHRLRAWQRHRGIGRVVVLVHERLGIEGHFFGDVEDFDEDGLTGLEAGGMVDENRSEFIESGITHGGVLKDGEIGCGVHKIIHHLGSGHLICGNFVDRPLDLSYILGLTFLLLFIEKTGYWNEI